MSENLGSLRYTIPDQLSYLSDSAAVYFRSRRWLIKIIDKSMINQSLEMILAALLMVHKLRDRTRTILGNPGVANSISNGGKENEIPLGMRQ